jgi:tetratricopeptide (TPR) repeat protein
LPEAAERWDEGRRHDTLRACFGFSLRPLAEREPALAEALARLIVFSGPFTDFLAVPVLFGAERVSEALEGEQEALFRQAAGALHRLWDRGLMEREEVPLGPRVEETLHLYSVHPALAPFARECLGEAARAEAEEGFFGAMRRLAARCWPLSEGGGVYANPLLAWLAYRALADLRRAAGMRVDGEGSLTRYHVGFLLQHFGDLEGAMGLYRESLAIKESLGDLRGKAATLAMMGQVLLVQGEVLGGLRALRQGLEILAGMGARADAEQVAGILAQVRQMIGAEMFDALWTMAGSGAPPVRALPVEEWIRESVRAARKGGPGQEELRALAKAVAGDAGAPEELRALARVLLQILDGNVQPDLSGLPEEWAGWVRAAVGAD